MTIQEMTDRMGISRSNFYFWRDGKTIPKKSSINKLADILKINLSWVDKNSVNIIESDIQIMEENLNMNMDASYIIKLQKEKIEQLEKKVKSMKKKLKNIGK
jgi:transcriptional regulator with XRE-family HTH domain